MEYTGYDGQIKYFDTDRRVSVDLNTYCYRYTPDIPGKMRIKGIILGHGWENIRFSEKQLSCYQEKEDDDMPISRNDKEEILAKALPMMAAGNNLSQTAKALDVPIGTLGTWIKKEQQKPKGIGINQDFENAFSQTSEPKPDNVDTQEPTQNQEESVTEFVPEITEGDSVMQRQNFILTRAQINVNMILKDPVALALLKELLEQGVA